MNGKSRAVPPKAAQRRPAFTRPKSRTSAWKSRWTPEIPTYSGGLGVLAGDTLRSAADLGVPMVGITSAPPQGLLQPATGRARATRPSSRSSGIPSDHLELLEPIATVTLEGRPVHMRCWRYPHRTASTATSSRSTCSTASVRPTRDWDQTLHRPPLRRRRALPALPGDDPRHGRRGDALEESGPPRHRDLPHERGPFGAAGAAAGRAATRRSGNAVSRPART